MLRRPNSILLIVDVQGNLANMVYERDLLVQNLQKLILGMQALEVPILWMEQNPRGLGSTIPEIADLLPGIEPIAKMSFSGCRNERFMESLHALNRRQVLVAGIETHICVYQTVADLMDMGYEVQVVADAVSSRSEANRKIGLRKMRDCGASLTSVETALFELVGSAAEECFKKILKIVK